jgi:hypothetical protein
MVVWIEEQLALSFKVGNTLGGTQKVPVLEHFCDAFEEPAFPSGSDDFAVKVRI